MRSLINANDKILHITPALNAPKIINAVLINARRPIRVNNMSSYFCVIRYTRIIIVKNHFLNKVHFSILQHFTKFDSRNGFLNETERLQLTYQTRVCRAAHAQKDFWIVLCTNTTSLRKLLNQGHFACRSDRRSGKKIKEKSHI